MVPSVVVVRKRFLTFYILVTCYKSREFSLVSVGGHFLWTANKQIMGHGLFFESHQHSTKKLLGFFLSSVCLLLENYTLYCVEHSNINYGFNQTLVLMDK